MPHSKQREHLELQKKERFARYEKQLARVAALQEQPDVSALQSLLEPLFSAPQGSHAAYFSEFVDMLHQHPTWTSGLSRFLVCLIDHYKQVDCLTDFGMTSDDTISNQIKKRIARRWLPDVKRSLSLYDLFEAVFDQKQGQAWLQAIDPHTLHELFQLLFAHYPRATSALDATDTASRETTARETATVDSPTHIATTATEHETTVTQADLTDHQVMRIRHNLFSAITILSYRLSGIGLHKELIKTYPDALNYQSAFIAQNIEINDYINSHTDPNAAENTTSNQSVGASPSQDAKQILVMLAQCQDVATHIRKHLFETGLSIRLTNKLNQIEKIIVRLTALVLLVDFQYQPDSLTPQPRSPEAANHPNSANQTDKNAFSKTTVSENTHNTNATAKHKDTTQDNASKGNSSKGNSSKDKASKGKASPLSQHPAIGKLSELFFMLSASSQNRLSVRHIIEENTYLMARKVVDNASKTGGNYISTNIAGYTGMFKKAAVGGVIIACMAILKILADHLIMAPFGVAFVDSMIYGLGFVLIHLVHGTVATKQPAMTAAAIASTIEHTAGKTKHKLNTLAELIVDIMRTQFIAISGNILLAMPIAFIIGSCWFAYSQTPLLPVAVSEKLIGELNPFTSLALVHAAIAGVYLFLAGLISGYYDNKAIYHQLRERVANHPRLIVSLGAERAARLGQFVETHLGAIMGNFLFGVMLGSTATLGYIFGLPLDIRHVAFASANFVYGVSHADSGSLALSVILLSFVGVLLIGLINLLVSFTLALLLALRARKVTFEQWGSLFKIVWVHFLNRPTDFFIPRPQPIRYQNIDNNGQYLSKKDS